MSDAACPRSSKRKLADLESEDVVPPKQSQELPSLSSFPNSVLEPQFELPEKKAVLEASTTVSSIAAAIKTDLSNETADHLAEIIGELLQPLSSNDLASLWRLLASENLTEDQTNILTTAYIRETLPLSHVEIFCETILLPRIVALNQAPSRILYGNLTATCKLHSTGVLHGLLVPLAKNTNLSKIQADLIVRLLKEALPPFLQTLFIKEVCIQLAAKRETLIDEQMDVLGKILSSIESGMVTDDIWLVLQEEMEVQVQNLSNSLKFSNILFQLVQKHLPSSPQHVPRIRNILSVCSNYLAKSALNKLQVLESTSPK